LNSWQYRYDTGWINRSDWTNVHLGSDTTLNTDSNVTHNLNAPLASLLVQVWCSTDGTDANAFLVHDYSAGVVGAQVRQVDLNNIEVHTGAVGFYQSNGSGGVNTIDTEDYYYKVKVFFLG
jgi:hypothetical protein